MTALLTLNRSQLAVLLAHHADVLAASLHADARSGLPELRAGMERAAELSTLHANALTADEETSTVAELLDSILTCPIDQPGSVEPPEQPPAPQTGLDGDTHHRLDDGSTHTHTAITNAGEACLMHACRAALEETRLRQEQYTLRAKIDGVLDEVDDLAADGDIPARAADRLRLLLRDALGLNTGT